MRGIGLLPRSATCAVLTGTLLAGAAMRPGLAATAGQDQRSTVRIFPGGPADNGSDSHAVETAMAVPRVRLSAGTSAVGLPQPLPPSEAARVRRIFDLQRQGAMAEATTELGRLSDDTLRGHILAARFAARPARVGTVELAEWLGRYADLPDAPAIRELLLKKRPAGSAAPARVATASLSAKLPPAGMSEAAARPARTAFAAGRDGSASQLGRAAWLHSHERDGQPAYVAGLADWRRGYFHNATAMFEAASTAADADAGLRAAAAFWAARAHLRAGDAAGWRPWMERAAAEPHVLHGMLARRVLGLPEPAAPEGAWVSAAILGEADVDAVAATRQGRLAFALLQVGEHAGAEAELRSLWPRVQAQRPLARAVFLVARAAGLKSLVADLADALHLAGTDAPLPRLRPRGGYTLSPALVYAVARVESGFASAAVSPAGAQGLMQMRPETAAMVTGTGGSALLDPATNLAVGQKFLRYLSRTELAGDNLLRVLASYNAGPAAAARFASSDDPLLFLETLPIDETRHYVQSTLSYLWGYSARMGLATPSLDAMAAGAWPKFSSEKARGDVRRQGIQTPTH